MCIIFRRIDKRKYFTRSLPIFYRETLQQYCRPFLEPFSGIYKCKLIVINSDEDIDDLVFGEKNMEKVIRLHLSKDHFDLLVDREEYISLEQEEVAVANRRIPKCW